MQIGGVGNGNPIAIPLNRPATERRAADAAQAKVASPAVREAEALTSAPPQGVDPSLWNVLTTEERAYFAKVRAMGPITYGPAQSANRPAMRGGRIDVTV